MFSIVIPTYNNLEYLKICLNSIRKNTVCEYEILIHVNDGSDGTLDYIKTQNLKYTYSKENIGNYVQQLIKLQKKLYINISYIVMMICIFVRGGTEF